MNRHIKSFVLVLIVCGVLISSCSFADNLAFKMGYVPKSQVEDLSNRLVSTQKDLAKALAKADANAGYYSEMVDGNAKLIALNQVLEENQADLSKWEDMQCVGPDGKLVLWEDLNSKYKMYLPIPQYRADKLMWEYHFKIAKTQWNLKADPYAEYDTVIFDMLYPNSFVINITNDCLILGPNMR